MRRWMDCLNWVRDDAASSEVWLGDKGALDAMPEGCVGVECSTLSVIHTRALHEAFERKGCSFIEAPLAGSRPQADAGQLIFLCGGTEADLVVVTPMLGVMGGATHHAGPVGAGAIVKLMVNALFGAQLAIGAELLGFAQRSGLNPQIAADILNATPVCSPALAGSMMAMNAGKFEPAFPIDLVAKGFVLLNSSAAAFSADIPVSTAVGEIYAQAKREGHGDANITGIAMRYLKAST